jgi:PAS domain S-box-containing protein
MRALKGSLTLPESGAVPAPFLLSAFAVAYLMASSFGQWLMVLPSIEITIWLPNGVVIAVLLSTPQRSWPVWLAIAAVGELVANHFWFQNALPFALGYASANVLEVLFAATVMSSYLPDRSSNITTLGRVFVFLGFGVMASSAIGATIGSTVSMLSGKEPFAAIWPLWWLGDATGILVATPLAFSIIDAWRTKQVPPLAKISEAVMIGALIVFAWGAIVVNEPAYAFAMFIPILWAAIRFEIAGTALAIAFLIGIVGFLAQSEYGAADGKEFARQHATFQVLILVLATTGYVVAAAVRQQRKAMTELAGINSGLEARVAERTRDIEMEQRRFKATFENAAVGMCILEPDGTLIRVNARLAEMLGYRPDEMEGRLIDDFTDPEDVKKTLDARDTMRATGQDFYSLEKRYRRSDGEIVWGRTSVSGVRADTGQITFEIKIIQDITARMQAETARQLLMYEVNHRCKNLLSLIQAVARQTASKTPEAFVETFTRRLQSLAANQDLLVKSSWESIQLDDLLRAQLEHLGSTTGDRITLSGPPIRLSPRAAQGLGMAVHELATNAAKYGSLSVETGRIRIEWAMEGEEFVITWQETEGPPISEPPTSRGFGSTVIDGLVRSTLNGSVTVDFAKSGLIWMCRCRLADLHA